MRARCDNALVAPGSRGLLNKAIIQSGACNSKPAAQAEAEGNELAHKVGCTNTATMVSCLREKPVVDLLNAQPPYYVLTDGAPVLPTNPLTAVNAGDYARVPIIIGSTHDELRSFFQSTVGWTEAQYDDFVRKNFGSHAGAVLKLYPWPADATDPAAVTYQVAAIGTDNGNLGPAPSNRASAGARPRPWPRPSRRPSRCTHTSSAPALAPDGIRLLVTSGVQATPRSCPTSIRCMTAASSPQASPRTRAKSPTRWRAIRRFVMHGEPKAANLPAWPAYAGGQGVLNFGDGGKVEFMTDAAFQTEHNCGFWNQFANAPYPMK